jgi:hypothetical protein
MDDDHLPDKIRGASEVAVRSLALFAVVGLAFGAERRLVLDWLSENDLWGELAPSEAGFIDTPNPSQKQVAHSGWLSERLLVLLWALGAIGQLPPADQQCDTSVFQDILPPFAEVSVPQFVAMASLRPDAELVAMADTLLGLHWEARDAKLKGSIPRKPVDIEVIQERHHAINWVIGYDGSAWDEVTTDT